MASQESIDLAQEMYVAYYGRPADPGGLAFWCERFDATDNLDDQLESFGDSAEFTSNFGSLSNADLVSNLYQQMFNRDAEPEGLAFFVDRLDSGVATLASIAKQIADGAQDSDRTALDNKIGVANTFTAEIEANDAPYSSGDIPAAQDLLAGVDETAASVTTAEATIPALLDVISGEIILDEDNFVGNFSSSSVAVNVLLDGDDGETEFVVTGSSFGDTFVLEEYLEADISGGGGIDTVDFSDANGAYTISLGVGTFSADENGDALPDFSGRLDSIESIIGSDEIDTVNGGDGDERIDGGRGIDILRGGAGNDTFVYEDETDLTTETVDGQTGTDILEFTGRAVDLTATAPATVTVETLSLTNLDGFNSVTLDLDNTAGFGPEEFTLIMGSSANDTLNIGSAGVGDFTGTALDDIETVASTVDLNILSTTLTDVINLSGAGGGEITAAAAGTYELAGTTLTGWDLLDGVAGAGGVIWVLNQTQVDALLDDTTTVLFDADMADAGTAVPAVVNDTLQASASLDLTRITGGLNVYEINFGSAGSIEVDDTQFLGAGLRLFDGAGGNGALIINDVGDNGVDLGVDGIGIDDVNVLALRGSGAVDLTIDENGFTDVGDVTGASTTLTIDTVAVTDLSGSDLSAFTVLDFTGATGGVVISNNILDNFALWGDGGTLTGILTFELAGTNLDLGDVDYEDVFAAAGGSQVTVTGTDGNDTVDGSDGDDGGTMIFVYDLGDGNDTFDGTDKTNPTGLVTINGDDGDDTINLGVPDTGVNMANGGAGDDTLVAADDTDVLSGGAGEDRFTVAADLSDGVAAFVTITDFAIGSDQFRLDININNTTTAFEDAIASNRLRVLVDDGSGMGTLNVINNNNAMGDGTAALNTYASATAVAAYINGLTNVSTDLIDTSYVVFGQNAAGTLLTGWVIRDTGTGTTTTMIAVGEISQFIVADLGGTIAESDLILV